MMLAYRLIPLTEAHSDALANSLLERAQDSFSTHSYHKLPPIEPRQRVHEIYKRLGEWRLRKEGTDRERAKGLLQNAHAKFRDGLIKYCERAEWLQHPETLLPAVAR